MAHDVQVRTKFLHGGAVLLCHLACLQVFLDLIVLLVGGRSNEEPADVLAADVLAAVLYTHRVVLVGGARGTVGEVVECQAVVVGPQDSV